MNLATTQLKDTYGNLLTIGTSAGSPTTGTIENGDGQDITDLRIGASGDSATESTLKIFSQGRVNATVLKENSDGASLIVGSANRLSLGTSNDEKLRIEPDGDIAFYDDANNQGLFWDASTARLGLGTQTPNHQLEIYGGSGAGSYNLFRGFAFNGTTNKRVEINIDNTESDPIAIFNTTRSGGAVVGHSFQIDSSEKMRIDSSGNVGINTTPSSKLDVAGDVTLDNILLTTATLPATNTPSINLRDTNNEIYFQAGSGNAFNFMKSDYTTMLTLDGTNSAIFAGNLGIGATSVTAVGSRKTLHIDDSSGSAIRLSESSTNLAFLSYDSTSFFRLSSSDQISFLTAGNPRMTIDSSGTVMVGATTESNWETVVGFRARLSGSTTITRDGNPPLYLNRITSDGGILEFRKGSTTVGSIASVATGKIGFFGSGGTGAVIDSSGRVGIGTTSPNSNHKAHIEAGSGNNTSLLVTTTDNADVAQVIIGHDEGLQGGLQLISDKTNSIAKIRVTNSSLFPLAFEVRGSDGTNERMRIDTSGRLLVGTNGTVLNGFQGLAQRACFSATGDTMTVAVGTGTGAYTGIHIDRTSSDGKAISFERGDTDVGSISITTTATAYNTSSDYRLKENVVELTGALDRVDQLNPSRFNFIADADTTVDGFLAHEVADVVPEAITGEKDATEEYEVTPAVLDDIGNVTEEAVMGTRPLYQGIDQSKLVPLLVGAIQELRAEIEQLKNQ